jgi:formylglycine-generating enzyme required for sulfatase activity
LSRETGRPYGLPSEAQWEYACRAGTTTPFHFGDLVTTDQANFHGAYPYRASLKGRLRARTLTVGSLPPNAFALHEMHGNVSEWCQDRWHDDYTEASKDAAPWESGDVQTRVLRGGSWNDLAGLARSAARDHGVPEFRDYSIGFRVVCSSPIE